MTEENKISIKLDLYENYHRKKTNLNDKFQLAFILVILLFFIVGNLFAGASGGRIIVISVSVLCVFMFFLSWGVGVLSFFSEYEHEKSGEGRLVITTDDIKWNDSLIEWKDIESISIHLDEIKNQLSWFEMSTQNNKSDGMNEIIIKASLDKVYSGFILVESITQKEIINKILREAIFINELSYEIAKSIIRPQSYKEHQDLKQLLLKNTKGEK